MQKLTIEQEDAEFLKIDRGVARISHHSKRSSVIVTEPIRETGPETPKTPKEGCLQWVRLWYHPTDESVVWKGSAPTEFDIWQTPRQTVTPMVMDLSNLYNSFQARRNKKDAAIDVGHWVLVNSSAEYSLGKLSVILFISKGQWGARRSFVTLPCLVNWDYDNV